MRKLIIVLAALATLAAAGPAGAAVKSVRIYGSTFSPKSVTVTAGDTVRWVNRDNARHQVLATRGQFVSPILRPRQTFSFTFRAAGTYRYKDELHPRLTGTVIVKGLPPTVTLAASAPIVSFGTKATLSGVVSNHRAGERVTIYYQPYPQPNPIERATLLTAAGGTYSFIVGPRILTSYQVVWNGAYATPTTIQVAPKLTLGKNGDWILHAWAGRSMAGRAVQFQRLNPATGQWVTLRKVLLSASSSARVSYAMPKGLSRLRLTMSVNQAGAGYLGVIGPTVPWRQR
ncbi:MAG: cupredoxin domain-containing protein [Gaiellaceae bacterium]